MNTQLARKLALALVLALLGVVGAQQQAPGEVLTDDPDAVVIAFGGTTVTKVEFDRAFDIAARSTAIGQGMPVSEEVLEQFEPYRIGFLQQYATQLVLAAEASDRGLAAEAAAVDAVVAELKQEQADDAAFEAWLDSAGYGDESELRETLEMNLSAQALIEELSGGIDVNDATVSDWYEANPEAVTTEDGSLMPLEAVAEQIEQMLVQQALELEVQAITEAAGLQVHPGGL